MPAQSKKILILYTSVGLGHKSIAENIGYYFKQADNRVKLADVTQVQAGKLINISKKVYQVIAMRFPSIWSFFYNSKLFTDISLKWRLKVAAKNHREVLNLVTAFQPEIIITTQTTASAVVAYLKQAKLFRGKFGIAFSDFHLHRYWLYDQADFYLANIEEQKKQMTALGIPAEKIFICGMSLKPKPAVNIKAIKNKLAIGANQKIVLLASGSQGSGVDENLIAQFIGQPKIKVIVVCGKNKKLFENLDQRFSGTNILVLGYYSPMAELYAIVDIYLTKPGGLSVTEALNWGVPILITHRLPGQEEHNYNYLMERGLIMLEPLNIVGEVLEELETGAFRQGLINNPNLPEIFGNGRELIKALNSLILRA